MKILLTSKTLEKGGAEMLISSIVPKLINKGCDVHVLYYKHSHSDLIEKLTTSGAKVVYIGDFGVLGVIRSIVNTYKYIKKFQPDIIFEHSPLVSSFNRLISGGYPIVYLEHSVFENYNIFTRYINAITSPLIKKTIFCSESVANSHQRDGIVLKNAIDPNPPIAIEKEIALSGCKVIVSVANVSKVKNHQMLIKAFEKVKSENVKLLIVGAPRDNQIYIESLVSNSPKRENIILFGQSDDVFGLLAQSNIFCLTSLYEGLPMSLLEAMSFGVVPVCTNVGGISDVIGDDCGYVVDLGDVDGLAEKFDFLLSNPAVHSSLSDSSIKKIANNYNLDVYIESLLRIFSNSTLVR